MSCCGNKRAALSQPQAANTKPASASASTPPAGSAAANPSPASGSPASSAALSQKMWADIRYENTGHTTVMCSGIVTGRIYRWPGKGTVQSVDYRDAAGLRRYSQVLREIR